MSVSSVEFSPIREGCRLLAGELGGIDKGVKVTKALAELFHTAIKYFNAAREAGTAWVLYAAKHHHYLPLDKLCKQLKYCSILLAPLDLIDFASEAFSGEWKKLSRTKLASRICLIFVKVIDFFTLMQEFDLITLAALTAQRVIPLPFAIETLQLTSIVIVPLELVKNAFVLISTALSIKTGLDDDVKAKKSDLETHNKILKWQARKGVSFHDRYTHAYADKTEDLFKQQKRRYLARIAVAANTAANNARAAHASEAQVRQAAIAATYAACINIDNEIRGVAGHSGLAGYSNAQIQKLRGTVALYRGNMLLQERYGFRIDRKIAISKANAECSSERCGLTMTKNKWNRAADIAKMAIVVLGTVGTITALVTSCLPVMAIIGIVGATAAALDVAKYCFDRYTKEQIKDVDGRMQSRSVTVAAAA